MILRSEQEEQDHNEYLLLEGCERLANTITHLYTEGHTFEALRLSVRDHLCCLRERNLLEYLPRRKRPDRVWIEGSWK